MASTYSGRAFPDITVGLPLGAEGGAGEGVKAPEGGFFKGSALKRDLDIILGKGPKGAKVSPGVTAFIGMMLAQWLMGQVQKPMMQRIQAQGIRGQAEAMTPENMYYRAMLPTTQAEAMSGKEALVNYLMGTAGPSLARGETLIGR